MFILIHSKLQINSIYLHQYVELINKKLCKNGHKIFNDQNQWDMDSTATQVSNSYEHEIIQVRT